MQRKGTPLPNLGYLYLSLVKFGFGFVVFKTVKNQCSWVHYKHIKL
jgi:hypothetical protein